MPRISAQRTDILRKPEIDEMMERAGAIDGPRLQCMIALAWIFGKRIGEILKLKKEDLWLDDNFLYVRFSVQKKRQRENAPLVRPYVKKIRLSHPYVPYILAWAEKVEKGFLFPGRTGMKLQIVKAKLKNSKGELIEKEYRYLRWGGHLSDVRARQLLKKVNPNAWWHLFRESLATYMAEMGASEEELMHWFDWSDPRTAHEYVKRGTKLIEKWAERPW